MTEPLKPRIDFTGTLEQDSQEAFKTAHTFSGTQADNLPRRCRTIPLLRTVRQRRSWTPRCAQSAACGAGWSPPVWRCLA